MQKLVDEYNVGIVYIKLIDESNYEKFSILPSNPESTLIPYMRLLQYQENVFVLTSKIQNENDGFDENGNIKGLFDSSNHDPDSFYNIEKSYSDDKF
jgi:hypothetical protein